MLESLVASILNRVVGSYVENFDAQQLNIGLLSGDVKLRNLRMKRSALDKLHLPVNVSEGQVGSLILQIPYSNLKNKPVKILIEDVLILASPDLHPDDSDYKRRVQAAKLEKLEMWEISQETKTEADSDAPATSTFVSKIIDNVQVTIKNIHIRYEDSACVPEHPFAMGITLSELSAISTNSGWEPAFISEVTNISHKLATLDSLSIYWDTDAEKMGVTDDVFKSRITDNQGQYMVRPINGQGFITLNKRPATESTPKINADLQFEEFSVGLEGAQYRDMLAVADQFQLYFRTREYRQHRPRASPKEDPRAWWKYAINTVLQNVQERLRVWDYNTFNKRIKDVKEYSSLYSKQYSTQLPAAEKKSLDEIEERYSLDDLILFRSMAKASLKAKPKVQQSSSWTSWLWGSSTAEKNSENEDEAGTPIEITEKQREEFMSIFDEPEKSVTMNQIILSAEVSLSSGSLRLKTDQDNEVAALFFNQSKVNIVKRSENLLFGISLDSFGIRDLCKDSKYPEVVKEYPRTKTRDQKDQLFWLMFEHKPLDHSADSTLSLKSQSVKIVYTPLFVERLIRFFTPPAQSQAVDAIVDAATRTVEELRDQTRLGLEYALHNHKSLMLKLDIDAPIIAVPENPLDADSPVVVLDAGHLSLGSELAPQEVINEVKSKQAQKYTEDDWKQLADLMFDKFRISLVDAQILVGPEFNATMALLDSSEDSNYRVLKKSTFDFLLMVSIVPDVATIPRCRISIDLPGLDMFFADVQYKQFVNTIQAAIPQVEHSQEQEDDEKPVLHRRVENDAGPAADKMTQRSTDKQVLFELDWVVKYAVLHVSRGWNDEKIADICLHGFGLEFKKRDTTMIVGVTVDDFMIEDFVDANSPPETRKFIESDSHSQDKNGEHGKLLTVDYKRHEGEQTVDINVNSVMLIINPVSILTVYDYIMSTFTAPSEGTDEASEAETPEESSQPQNNDTTSVNINLRSITGKVIDDTLVISTLELASARMTVDLLGEALKFQCVLGAVSITDEIDNGSSKDSIARQLVSIEGGGDLADIRYETVPTEEYDAFVYFRSGSLKINIVDEPIARLLNSLSRLLQMKGVYDQARMLAFDQAQNFDTPERMKLDVVLKAPIVVFPRYNTTGDLELFSSNLGEIYVQNSFDANKVQSLEAGFRNLEVCTEMYLSGEKQSLEIMSGTNLTVNTTIKNDDPNITGDAKLDSTSIDVTEHQFHFAMECINTISSFTSKLSEGASDEEVGDLRKQLVDEKHIEKPKWQVPEQSKDSKSLSLLFSAPAAILTLYQHTKGVRNKEDLKSHALSQFKLDNTTIKVQNDSKDNLSADISIKAFTIDDLRANHANKFPHIVPAATHDDYQLMCRYTKSPDRAPNIDVSLDGLCTIIAVDYLVALQKFAELPQKKPATEELDDSEGEDLENFKAESINFDEANQDNNEIQPTQSQPAGSQQEQQQAQSQSDQPNNEMPSALPKDPQLTMAVSIVDMYATILADASNEDTEAIVFKIEHIVASIGKNSSLGISKVGMYLRRMRNSDKQRLQLLDDFNITASAENMDSRADALLAKVQAHIDPLVFRCSLREITLATEIFNQASTLWAAQTSEIGASEKFSRVTMDGKSVNRSHKSNKTKTQQQVRQDQAQQQSNPGGRTKILGEELIIETSGFRAVIIDTHHMPILDFVVKPFNVDVHNWSSDLTAKAHVESYTNFYSFAKSAWEPLIDRVNLFFHMSKPNAEHAPVINIQTKNTTNLEITPELLELVDQLQSYFQQDTEKIFSEERRLDDQPYRIVNQTGFDIDIWSETQETSVENREVASVKNGETVKWSFFDWRKIRELLGGMSQEVNLGIEFKDSPFDPLHSVNVNLTGEHLHLLKPTDQGHHRLAIEIFVKKSLKYVVIRSTICIANETMVPLDIRLVSQNNQIEMTLDAGDRYGAPILDVDAEIYVKPKNGFYGWSKQSIWWRELRKKEYGVECPGEEDSFFVHAIPYYPRDIPLQNHYPYMTINLVAPIELINNLPYDFDYSLYCKNTRQDWKNTIKSGKSSQIHVVNRSQLLLLSVNCEEVGYRSEPAVINSAHPSFSVEQRLSLKHSFGHHLKLDIKYIEMPKKKGTAILILAPYVVLNSTGHKLTVATKLNRVECEIDHQGDELSSKPQMWSFEQPDSKNKAVLRIDDNSVTSPVNFTAVGTTSEVVVRSHGSHREMYLGVTLKEGEGRFKRTNVVQVAPRFILFNQVNRPILFKEPGEVEPIGTLQTKTFEPIGFVSNMSNRQLCLSFTGDGAKWSSAFVMSNVGTSFVRVYEKDKPTTLIKVDVVLSESSLFIYLNKCTNWPYSIRNLTEIEFEFFQANPNVDEDGNKRRSFTPTKYRLPPMTAMPYSWDFPAASNKELVLTHGGKQRKIILAEIGELEPTKFPTEDGIYVVDLNVVANGPLQALVISPFSNETSNYNLVRTNTRASSTSTTTKFEIQETDDTASATHIQLELEGIGISYVNSNYAELCYASMKNITVVYRNSEIYEYLAVRCQWIQVDNALVANTAFPVLVYPTVLPRSGEEIQQHPVFSAAITRLNDESYGLKYIKHASLLLQEITVELDEDILLAFLQMIKRPSEGEMYRTDESLFFSNDLAVPKPPSTIQNRNLYFEILHLQPLQVNLSFTRTGALSDTDMFTSLNGGAGYMLDAISMAIGNVNDAPIRLNALMIENLRTTFDSLQSNVTTHYSQELIYQMYKVVGCVDLIGNPVGLWNNLSSGFMDLFYEPYLGYSATDRPQDLGIGIAKGGAMFLKKTVFGFSDSVSKVTGSVSKGLLAITMDPTYQRKQRSSRIRNRPANALFGVSYGATSLANSIVSGISGLALAPLEGATAQGAPGFFKGVAKGIFGLPTKTAIGVLDFASNISEGVKNNTAVFDNNTIVRARPPRFIAEDHILRAYNERDAIGQQFLHSIRDGRYKDNMYLAYTQVSSGDIVIVSYENIVCARIEGLKEQWSVSFPELRSVSVSESGISLVLRDGVQGPFIPAPQEDTRRYIQKSISKAVTGYNLMRETIS